MDWPTGCRPSGDGILIRWGTPKRSEKLDLPHTADGKRKAVKIRAQRIHDYKYGTQTKTTQSAAFFTVAQRWLQATNKEKGWSESTYQGYRNNLNRYWIPYFGEMLMTDITYEAIDSLWETFDFNTKKTAKNVLGPLKGVFSYAYRKNLVPEDLGTRFHVVGEQGPELDPFTPEEKERILSALLAMASEDLTNEMAEVYWTVVFDTGMRTPSELCALKWDDYDGSRFRVKAAVTRRKEAARTKTKKARDVYVTRRIQDRLKGFHTRFKRGYIFLNTHGTQIKDHDWVNLKFYEACDRAEVRRRRPYNTRHTFATMALMAGQKPGRIAKHLGHSLEMFYRKYADWIDREDDAADILAIEDHYLTTGLRVENGTNMAPGDVSD